MAYEEDENGYITIENNPISKSGIFQYLGRNISESLDPDKIYNVWRPEIELNNPITIKSFKLNPWIPYHVMLGKDFVDAELVGVQGVTGETVEFKNGTLFSTLRLFGEGLKKLIKAGLKELSCGFRCDWIIRSGITPDGKPYDVVQTNIRGNHLASVDNARVGSDVSVAMDRAVFALDSIDINPTPNQNGENMDLKELTDLVSSQGGIIKKLSVAMDEMTKYNEDVKNNPPEKEKTAKDKEDEEADKKKKAEDDEKDKEKSKAMDSAIASIATLTEEVKSMKSSAMDGVAVFKAYADKQDLAGQVSNIVGEFDHSDMDSSGVAKYGLKKMGIACDSGSELAMMKGFLHSRRVPTYTVDHGNAQDSSKSAKSDILDKAGL